MTGEPNIRFYAGQPLLGNNGERLGTLCVIDQRRRNVSVDELEILRDLAGWCSNELRLVSLSRVQRELISECDELRRRAMVDPLTQLWNRAAIQEILTRELERARRGKAWLSLVFADIDHFKNVNDTYGHSAGDDMLRQVAGRIRSSVRAYDAVGRFGGEEFLVVASECSEWDGGTLANRLRVNVGDRTFDTTWGPIQITLSAGVAVTQLGEERSIPKPCWRPPIGHCIGPRTRAETWLRSSRSTDFSLSSSTSDTAFLSCRDKPFSLRETGGSLQRPPSCYIITFTLACRCWPATGTGGTT